MGGAIMNGAGPGWAGGASCAGSGPVVSRAEAAIAARCVENRTRFIPQLPAVWSNGTGGRGRRNRKDRGLSGKQPGA